MGINTLPFIFRTMFILISFLIPSHNNFLLQEPPTCWQLKFLFYPFSTSSINNLISCLEFYYYDKQYVLWPFPMQQRTGFCFPLWTVRWHATLHYLFTSHHQFITISWRFHSLFLYFLYLITNRITNRISKKHSSVLYSYLHTVE